MSKLENLIAELKLAGLEAALSRQMENPQYRDLPFEDRLLQLLQAESAERLSRKIKRNMAQAKFKDLNARVEDIDYTIPRGLDKSAMLSLISGGYLHKKQNILITGPTGTGKSFIAQALANMAVRDGLTARYYRLPRLMDEMKLARLDGTYVKGLNKIARYNLLILDDFGINPLTADDANDLLEVIEDRAGISSVIVTSQLPVDRWYDYLNNDTVADAILDRLLHSSHKIKLKGESIRKIQADNA
ncbi:IS21-like element helper ATPase IstB [Deferribacteres bacterium DY0037]